MMGRVEEDPPWRRWALHSKKWRDFEVTELGWPKGHSRLK